MSGEQADPPGVFCKGPNSLPIGLNASVVDDGVEAGAQDEEEDKEGVSLLVGAWHEAQEDEGLCEPDEEVELGGDNVPAAPGLPGGAAKPNILLVLLTAVLEDEAVEDRGEEDGAEEDTKNGEVEWMEEWEVPGGAAEATPGPAEAAVVQGPALPVQEGTEGEEGGEERRAAGHEEEEAPPLGGGEDGGWVADVDPAIDGDGEAEESSHQRGGERDGDTD